MCRPYKKIPYIYGISLIFLPLFNGCGSVGLFSVYLRKIMICPVILYVHVHSRVFGFVMVTASDSLSTDHEFDSRPDPVSNNSGKLFTVHTRVYICHQACNMFWYHADNGRRCHAHYNSGVTVTLTMRHTILHFHTFIPSLPHFKFMTQLHNRIAMRCIGY